MKNVYIYLTLEAYRKEKPDVEISNIREVKDDGKTITLVGNDDFTHKINMDKIFCYTYK